MADSKKEIMKRLEMFEKFVLKKYPKTVDNPIEVTLVGGSAGVLGYNFPRATRDVDSLPITPKELDDLASAFGFHTNCSAFFNLFDGYEKRRMEITGFTYIKVYVLSAIDLILSKLDRAWEKDIEDCKYLISKGFVTIEEFEEYLNEWKEYAMTSPLRIETTRKLILGEL